MLCRAAEPRARGGGAADEAAAPVEGTNAPGVHDRKRLRFSRPGLPGRVLGEGERKRMILQESLFANLTLGVNPDDPDDADISRVQPSR